MSRLHSVLGAIMAAALVAAAAPALAATTLKVSLLVPLDSTQGQAAQRFKELVEEKSGGTLEVRLFPSSQLGEIYEVIDAQQAGSVEMSLLGYDTFSKFSPTLTLAGLPFIFADRAHAYKFYESQMHEDIKQEILDNKAVRVLGNAEWNQGPYKILLSKDPVLDTDAMQGVPMRVPANEVDLLIWGEAIGANVTPVPWPEAPLALRQGLVRAIELPADFVRPHKFYENAKYLTETRHRYQVLYPTISEKTWQELSAEEQQALLEASKEAGLGYTDAVQTAWEDDQEFLKKEGVVIVDFDISPWHEAAVEKARRLEENGTWAEGLVEKVMALNE
jgi:TRAP-type C4-dicarboxylate transport system substrate-binding protein